ncbi:MAG TPA: N-acetylglucosamine/diacetylchitobiose ABC transporter substrate-binding protein [Thermomicrobiales bacterium]|nr:N-acetylglucosamine/diacetylchitobiose ABC transporter substrate-binding protein [Thermomicrobiales bacterium]
MDNDQVSRIDQLFREVAEKGMSRRQMIQRAAVMGISASALTVAFVQKAQFAVAQGDDNPLGVDPDAPLDVVIFKGGYGDDYAIHVKDEMYGALYPNAEITYIGTQRLQEQFQARVVDGNPPDIMDNSGAGNFNTTSLYNDGQLADLTDLMEAPAYGQDGVAFAESLSPGTQRDGVFDGKQHILKYVMSAYGLWYNKAKFEEKGWEYPETWDGFLELCQTIKDDGEMAPFTWQGQYPYYIRAVFDQLVFKSGGWDAQLKLDNIEPDAWTQPVVKQALEALQKLQSEGYQMDGTEGLSHTESQTFWIQGEAAFIPCGAWLENEMKDVLEEFPDFELVVAPVPNLTADDVMPFSAIQASAGEDFIVFDKGKNVQGGKEFLRLLFSKEGGKFFSEATKSLTVVQGAAEGLELGTAFQSVQDAINNAGENIFVAQWAGFYADMDDTAQKLFSELMNGQTSPDDLIEEMQALADKIREDDSIPKYTVEAPA